MITSRLLALGDGPAIACLAWRFDAAMLAASTASVGGGIGLRQWVVNAQVPSDYRRRDLDEHISEIAAALGLHGRGIGMLTAAEVGQATASEEDGVSVEATVGLTWPVWAAAPDAVHSGIEAPGTLNLVAILPVRHTEAALANLLCTVTEAKVQALLDGGVDGTGTASDAVTILCPASGPWDAGARGDGGFSGAAGPAEAFGGPRSLYGVRVARCVYEAVRAGIAGQ